MSMNEQEFSSFSQALLKANSLLLTKAEAEQAAVDIGDTPELTQDGKGVHWHTGGKDIILNWPYS